MGGGSIDSKSSKAGLQRRMCQFNNSSFCIVVVQANFILRWFGIRVSPFWDQDIQHSLHFIRMIAWLDG